MLLPLFSSNVLLCFVHHLSREGLEHSATSTQKSIPSRHYIFLLDTTTTFILSCILTKHMRTEGRSTARVLAHLQIRYTRQVAFCWTLKSFLAQDIFIFFLHPPCFLCIILPTLTLQEKIETVIRYAKLPPLQTMYNLQHLVIAVLQVQVSI